MPWPMWVAPPWGKDWYFSHSPARWTASSMPAVSGLSGTWVTLSAKVVSNTEKSWNTVENSR